MAVIGPLVALYVEGLRGFLQHHLAFGFLRRLHCVYRRGIRPLARILGFTTASLEPVWFTVAPIDAIRKLLQKTGVDKDRVGLYEINEAFAGVAIAAIRGLTLDPARVNVNGGAVSMGHPIGASGARILTTLLYAMEDRNETLGIASLCIGGGEAVAMLVERL